MAAQPETMKVLLDLDVAAARTKVKSIRKLAQAADQDLAQLEERLDGFAAKLASYGIRLEVRT